MNSKGVNGSIMHLRSPDKNAAATLSHYLQAWTGKMPLALAKDVMLTVSNRMGAGPTIQVGDIQPIWARVSLWLIALLALWWGVVHAEELSGKVVAVADGDTLTVLVDHRQVKVRLTEIDAPEKKQSFGARSRQSLADMTFGRVVRVVTLDKDRYGRTLGRIYVGQHDINAEQVRRGMAWVYDRYVTDRSLYQIQEEAHAARRGLWRDKAPLPPWEWRAANRRKLPAT